MSDRFHWAPAARMLLVAGERLGVPKARIIEHSGADRSEFRPRRFSMSWEPLRALTQSALELTGEPALGLLAGLEGTLNYHGSVGSYYMHCSPWREWQNAVYAEALPKVSNILRLWHEEQGEVSMNCAAPIPPDDPLIEPHLHLVLSQQIFAMRLVFGGGAEVQQISLRSKRLGDPDRLARMMGCPVVLGQPLDCFVVPRGMLEKPLPLADPWLREQLRPQFESFLRLLDQGMQTTLAVRIEVENALANGAAFNLEGVALALRLRPRTLQDRLSAEGTTLTEVLDAVRKDLSLRQLAFPSAKIAAVGALAGFSDPAAFTRAFRRWTGVTPSEWQERRGQLPTAPAAAADEAPR